MGGCAGVKARARCPQPSPGRRSDTPPPPLPSPATPHQRLPTSRAPSACYITLPPLPTAPVPHCSGRDLVNMAKKRPNVIPIIEDARHPQKYRMLVPMVDVVFADVAQPDQVPGVVGSCRPARCKVCATPPRPPPVSADTRPDPPRPALPGAHCWPQLAVLPAQRRLLCHLHQGEWRTSGWVCSMCGCVRACGWVSRCR